MDFIPGHHGIPLGGQRSHLRHGFGKSRFQIDPDPQIQKDSQDRQRMAPQGIGILGTGGREPGHPATGHVVQAIGDRQGAADTVTRQISSGGPRIIVVFNGAANLCGLPRP